MADLIKRAGKYYLRSHGGYVNRDRIAPMEIEVKPPLQKIEEFTYVYPNNAYGEGHNTVKIYQDSQGKIIAVHSFTWVPAEGYSWEEGWEKLTDNAKEIEKLKAYKEEIVEENL